VLQRNAGDHPLIVMTDPPVEVQPGGVIDHKWPITGFTPEPSAPVAEKPTATTKAAKAAATDAEETP
jgi:hypothetical protein